MDGCYWGTRDCADTIFAMSSESDLSLPSNKTGKCRLTLTINGVHFSVPPIKTEDADIKRAFRLRKQPLKSDVIFDVADTVHGAICDCPDFVFRRDGLVPRGCLYMRGMKAVGLL
jgi:hypothetical protein